MVDKLAKLESIRGRRRASSSFFQTRIPGAEAVWVYSLPTVSHCNQTVSVVDSILGQFQGQFVGDSSDIL